MIGLTDGPSISKHEKFLINVILSTEHHDSPNPYLTHIIRNLTMGYICTKNHIYVHPCFAKENEYGDFLDMKDFTDLKEYPARADKRILSYLAEINMKRKRPGNEEVFRGFERSDIAGPSIAGGSSTRDNENAFSHVNPHATRQAQQNQQRIENSLKGINTALANDPHALFRTLITDDLPTEVRNIFQSIFTRNASNSQMALTAIQQIIPEIQNRISSISKEG